MAVEAGEAVAVLPVADVAVACTATGVISSEVIQRHQMRCIKANTLADDGRPGSSNRGCAVRKQHPWGPN